MAVVTVTKDNFEEEVLNSQIPVLVDFWAAWCGPCKAVGPVLDSIAQEFDGKLKVAKINVDEQGELALQFKIMSIPTMALFKEGQIANKKIGASDKEDILTHFEIK